MSSADGGSATYDVIYATDLVYQPACHQLCGDAHCCHYDRYKRFGPPEERGTTVIPMLAGEYQWLDERGLLGQYPSHERQRSVFAGRGADYVFEVLKVPAPEGCPCDHDRRPTLCRLYPVLPLFEPGRGLVGLDTNFGVFEEIEDLAGTPRACPLTATSFAQVQLLLRICAAISADPHCLFSLMAYAGSKRQFRRRVSDRMSARGISAYHALGELMAAGEVVDRGELASELDELLGRFRSVHGADFVP